MQCGRARIRRVQGFAINFQVAIGLIGGFHGFCSFFSNFYRLCWFCGPSGPTGHVGSIGSTGPMGSLGSMGCVGYICGVCSVHRFSGQKKRVLRTHFSQQCESASISRIDARGPRGITECTWMLSFWWYVVWTVYYMTSCMHEDGNAQDL